MRRRTLAESLLLAAAPLSAAAQSGAPGPLDVYATYGAKPDAVWGVTDCSAAAHSSSITCVLESFTTTDLGKAIILDDGSGAGVPLVGSINGIGSSHTITISNPTSIAVPIVHIPVLEVSSAGVGYGFGTTQTLQCGGGCTTSVVGTTSVLTAKAPRIAVNGGGSGGMPNTTCVATIPGQTAFPGQQTVVSFPVSSGGSATTPVTIINGGAITADSVGSSSGTYTHPLSAGTCGFSMAPTITLQYGVVLEQVTQVGIYSNPSCSGSNAGTTISSDYGTGLKVLCPGNYTSTASWGTDNTIAFEHALADANAYASTANPRPIYIPAGNYLLQPLNTAGASGSAGTCSIGGASCMPTCTTVGTCTNFCASGSGICQANIAVGYGAWFGDEHNHSNLFVIPSSNSSTPTADLFSWLNADDNGSQPQAGNTQTFSNPSAGNGNQAGSAVRNLTIIGDRAAQSNQNAMSFYGRTSSVFVDNVTVSYMLGHAFGAGYIGIGTPAATLIESRLLNSSFDHDGYGLSSAPVLDIGSNKAVGENNLDLTNLAITYPYGPGISIHAENLSGGGPRQIRLTNIRIEGTGQSLLGTNLLPPPDLLLLTTQNTGASQLSDVTCRNLQLVNPVLGAAALHITTSSTPPGIASNIDCEGSIISEPATLSANAAPSLVDYGRGAMIEACKQCKITMAANTSQDVNLMVGTLTAGSSPPSCAGVGGQSALGGTGLVYDGEGAESALSTCLDPLSVGLIAFPNRQLLANGSLANTSPGEPIGQVVSQVSGTSNTLTFGTTSSANVTISVTAPLWTVIHTGSSGNFTDMWDTGQNVWNAVGSIAAAGQVYRMRYCNTTSSAGTLAPNTGITGLPVTITAGTCINLVLELTSTNNVTIVSG